MLVMTSIRNTPELVFSGPTYYPDELVSCGERSILINAAHEQTHGTDALAWSKNTIGRQVGDFTLYVRHETHVEEFRVTSGRAKRSVHPTWDYLEQGIDTLVPLLRGEWTGHTGHDGWGNAFPVEPATGQKGYKLFLSSMPRTVSLPGKMLAKFFSDARARNLIVPGVYHDSVKSLAGGLNLGGEGLVYNAHYAARHGDIVTGQGRSIPVADVDQVRAARRVVEAVGFTPDDLINSTESDRVVFNIRSARWAAENWHKEVMPVGPKARARAAKKATA